MAFDTTQITKLVDPSWQEKIQETDEFSAAFWTRLKDLPGKDANIKGRTVKVRTKYNQSYSYAGFGAASGYAQGGNSEFQTFSLPYRTPSTQTIIDQETIDNDDGKSHYHPVAQELMQSTKNALKALNRDCLMGDGLGTIAVVTSNYAGGSATNVVCAPGTGFGNKGSQFVGLNKKVQIYDSTGATLRNGTIGGEGILTVSTNTTSTGTIVMTSNAPSDMIATDIVVHERSAQRGVNGVEYWVDDSGSLFTLSRSAYPGLQSTVTSGSSGALMVLVEAMFAKMAHRVGEDAALSLKGSSKHEVFWSPTQRQRYRQEALGLGITMAGASQIDMGYAHKEEINGFTATCIRDHSNTKIHFLRMSDWYRIARNGGKRPFETQPIHGNESYNLNDSQGRISGGLGFVQTGYVNVGCEDVRAQGCIESLPTSGLETGN